MKKAKGRQFHKVDTAQAEIVGALRLCGALVHSTAPLGHGFPDLVVWGNNRLWLLEVKTGKGRLTPEEVEFQKKWPVDIVRSAEEAIELIWGVRG